MGLFLAKQYVSFYPLDVSTTKLASSKSVIDEEYAKNAAIQAISDPATVFTAIAETPSTEFRIAKEFGDKNS
jgi:hypothetical protein